MIVQNEDNRAVVKRIGIKKAETERHLQVDSDVILRENWFNEAGKFVEEDVGAACHSCPLAYMK